MTHLLPNILISEGGSIICHIQLSLRTCIPSSIAYFYHFTSNNVNACS